MATLRELLGIAERRGSVIKDACEVLDLEVADKSGLSGVAIKAAYAVVKGIKPGFVRDVVDNLLNDFLDALDPSYQQALSTGEALRKKLESAAGPTAEALLAITDTRAERAERPAVKKTYEKLRPTAKKHVEAAMPRIAAMLERQLATL
jgi:hypothetical protein